MHGGHALNGSDMTGQPACTYTPSTAKAAMARFTITYDEECVDLGEKKVTINVTFAFASATQAFCEQCANNTLVGEVPALVRLDLVLTRNRENGRWEHWPGSLLPHVLGSRTCYGYAEFTFSISISWKILF